MAEILQNIIKELQLNFHMLFTANDFGFLIHNNRFVDWI